MDGGAWRAVWMVEHGGRGRGVCAHREVGVLVCRLVYIIQISPERRQGTNSLEHPSGGMVETDKR
jgi:hypothetical protein